MSGEYPEHDKLTKIKDQSQAIGEFMDWLADDGIFLAGRDEDDAVIYPLQKPVRQLLHEFFGIDENKIEAEKREMLKLIRETNAQAETVTLKGGEL